MMKEPLDGGSFFVPYAQSSQKVYNIYNVYIYIYIRWYNGNKMHPFTGIFPQNGSVLDEQMFKLEKGSV